jgi:hypothetical protein
MRLSWRKQSAPGVRDEQTDEAQGKIALAHQRVIYHGQLLTECSNAGAHQLSSTAKAISTWQAMRGANAAGVDGRTIKGSFHTIPRNYNYNQQVNQAEYLQCTLLCFGPSALINLVSRGQHHALAPGGRHSGWYAAGTTIHQHSARPYLDMLTGIWDLP